MLKCCDIFSEQLSQYGEMTTVYLGRKPAIFLNTIELVKEALVQKASSFFRKASYTNSNVGH